MIVDHDIEVDVGILFISTFSLNDSAYTWMHSMILGYRKSRIATVFNEKQPYFLPPNVQNKFS